MTLLEMVIAMSMMTVVFAAVVPVFAAIRNSWATYEGDAERLQNARILTEHVYQHLLGATAVTEVSLPSQTTGYIGLSDADGRDYRYELGLDGYVRFGTPDNLAILAGPVSELVFTCYDGDDFSASTTEVQDVRFVTIGATFPASSPLGSARSYATSVFLRADTADESVAGTVDPGIAVAQDVDWGGYGTTIDSYRSTLGSYDASNPGDEAMLCVNATGKHTIRLWTATTLRGDAYVGPDGDPDSDIRVSGNSVITGTRGVLSERVDIPTLSAPTGPPFRGKKEGHLVVKNETLTLTSDHHYGKLQIQSGGTLKIDGDVRILLDEQFKVIDDGELEILADSSLRLYCANKVDLEDTARINVTGADPTRLRLYMTSNKHFKMNQQAQVYGVLQNPNGGVEISGDAQFFGKIRAKSLQGGGRIHVDLDCSFDLGED